MPKYFPKSQILTNLYAQDGENDLVDGVLMTPITQQVYTGYFWANSKGEYWSGKTPSHTPLFRLLVNKTPQIDSYFSPETPRSATKVRLALLSGDPEIEIDGISGTNPTSDAYSGPGYGYHRNSIITYIISGNKGIKLLDPQEEDAPYHNPVLPTENDYNNGSFLRYFAKKRNAYFYIEIDKIMYGKLSSLSAQVTSYDYAAFRLFWRLTGEPSHVEQVNKNLVDLTIRKKQTLGLDKFLNHDYTKYHRPS